MFTTENTQGFEQQHLDLMNAALDALLASGEIDASNANDIVFERANDAAAESVKVFNANALAGLSQEACDAEQFAAFKAALGL